MPSILDDPEFLPKSKSVLDDPEFLPPKQEEAQTMTPEEAERFITYGPFSKDNIRSLIKEDRSFLEKKLPDEGADKIGNIIGALIHGGFDSASYGAGHRKLDDLAAALGGKKTFEARKKVFERTAPWAFAGGGMGASLFGVPSGAKAAEYLKSAPGVLSKLSPKNLNILAKAGGISWDALQAALYGYNTSKEGDELEGAGKGAGISAGLSLGLPLIGKGLSKSGSTVMDWLFGLPKDIQDKIKANPDILKNVKGGEELANSLTSLIKKAEDEAFKKSEIARSKLDPNDLLTPERIGSAVQNVQEGLGDVAGLPLEQKAFNRLEDIKKGFENKLTTPNDLKTFLQKLRKEAYEKTTEGPTKEALEKTQFRLDQILKENDEYRRAMKPTDQLTRLLNEVKKRYGIQKEVSPETSIKELMPSDKTVSKIFNPDKLEKSDRYVRALSGVMDSNFASELEKARLDKFLSQARTNQNTGAKVLFPFLGALAGAPSGAEGLLIGGAGAGALDKYGRRIGADILAKGSKASDFLNENKLFKEILSKDSNLNRKYAASHFIRSQVDPDYNKESSK